MHTKQLTDKQAKLVEENIGLVYHAYHSMMKIMPKGVAWASEDDYIQSGMLALCSAARGFNEDKGTKFSTYAYISIRNRLKTFIDNLYKASVEKTTDSPDVIHYIEDYEGVEFNTDIESICEKANLDEEERAYIDAVVLGDVRQSDFARSLGYNFRIGYEIKMRIRRKLEEAGVTYG